MQTTIIIIINIIIIGIVVIIIINSISSSPGLVEYQISGKLNLCRCIELILVSF